MTNHTNVHTTPTVHNEGDEYTASGMRVPAVEVRAREIAEQAGRWLAFTTERTRMKPHTLTAKALASVAFSVHRKASSLAVPSKLVGTSRHQGRLREIARSAAVRGTDAPWDPLELDVQDDRVAVSLGGRPMGEVQAKHVPWVLPLVPFGLGLRLTRVTGTGTAPGHRHRLGCNVAFTDVGVALGRMAGELGAPSGDGAGEVPETGLRLVAPGETRAPHGPVRVRVLPEREALTGDPDDVVLWRTREGTAHASVAHVVRHSPTGIEWGYLGSGPSDLALSVLTALADGRAALALYQRFKQEVVARVPEEGGVLRAAEVRAWVDRARHAGRPHGVAPDRAA